MTHDPGAPVGGGIVGVGLGVGLGLGLGLLLGLDDVLGEGSSGGAAVFPEPLEHPAANAPIASTQASVWDGFFISYGP